jgi:2-amino-4-hydroxy-6-hydroxymethyldihydropteridine diphosphokinase
MTLCAISLGGNVGDVPATFAAAIRELETTYGISNAKISRIYRTTPMGADAGAAFHNAACVFETSQSADMLLFALQMVENHCGRVRTVHWGPRTLDLDLIFYGDQVLNSTLPLPLVVPHPGCWYRRFVLDPLVDLIPDFIHPVLHESVRALRDRLLIRPLPVWLWGGWPQVHERLLQSVANDFPGVEWIEETPAMGRKASIRFAFPEAAPESIPRIIVLPGDISRAVHMVRDVLTAALDEPEPC